MSEETTLDEFTSSEPRNESGQEWESVKLEDVSGKRSENVDPEQVDLDRHIGLEHITPNTPSPEWESVDGLSSTKRRFEAGDVLFAKLRPNLEKSAQPDFEGVASTDIFPIISEQGINSKYLLYRLSSKPAYDHARRTSVGTRMPRTSWNLFSNFEFGLPPLEEQRKIATVLHNVDQAIQKTEELIEQIEMIRTGFVHDIFDDNNFIDITERTTAEKKRIESILETRRKVWAEAEKERQQRRDDYNGEVDESKYSPPLDMAIHRLPELPDVWTWVSLDTFIGYDIDYRGKTPPYSDSGIRVISSGNIQNGELVFENEKYVSKGTYNNWLDRGVPREGDLLVTTEAPVGKTALYPEGTYLPTRRIITFRTVGIKNRYLQAAIRHPYVQNYLTAQSGGSTVGRILKDHLLKTPIPLPPLKDQQQITDALKKFDQRIANESEYANHLQRLKQALMQDLLSGKVRTTDSTIAVPDEVRRHG